MELTEILQADMVFLDLKSGSKKQILSEISAKIAQKINKEETEIFQLILEREKLGSTGVGRGVAIPHARVDGLEKIIGAFARLDEPIEFDAVDDQPVDLIFMLLAPEKSGSNHLKALSTVSRTFRSRDFCEELHNYNTPQDIFDLLVKQSKVENY